MPIVKQIVRRVVTPRLGGAGLLSSPARFFRTEGLRRVRESCSVAGNEHDSRARRRCGIGCRRPSQDLTQAQMDSEPRVTYEGSVSTFEAIFAPPVRWVAEQLGAVPQRPGRRAVVLVAAERQAHAIRRHICIECGRPQDLAGVLFLRPLELARELLLRAGEVCRPGREDVRRLRILHLFESRALAGDLRYFNAEQLRSGQGYVDAFARTIADMEASGLSAELLTAISQRIAAADQRGADRLHDVALTWQAADAGRGSSASTAQLLTEAAAVVARRPELLAAFGPIFAVLAASPSAALLRFLRALPAVRIVLQEARPQRTGTQRWRQLIAGSQRITPAAADAQAEQAAGSELDVVQRFLFALPEVLTDPQRLRSLGPDGTVDLEEYPSIEDEIEAAATWVTEQIAGGTALEQIALVVPEVDAYAPLLIDRLARLPQPFPSAC